MTRELTSKNRDKNKTDTMLTLPDHGGKDTSMRELNEFMQC
jgi:hypothetical protein